MPASTSIEQYWKNTLSNIFKPTSLDSQNGYHLHDQNSKINHFVKLNLSNDITSHLIQICQRYELDFLTIFQAMTASLISTYSGDVNVIFGCCEYSKGSTTHSKPLPIYVCLDQNQTLLNWVKTISDQWSQSNAYAQASLEEIKQWSNWSDTLPLFNAFLSVEYASSPDDLIRRFKPKLSELFLHLHVAISNDIELGISFKGPSYSKEQFSALPAFCETWLKHFCTAIHHPLKQLELISESERQKLLFELNQTAIEYPNLTIPQVFEQQSMQMATNVAVILPDLALRSHQQLTYEELNHRANGLAHLLLQHGIQPGTYVAVMMERSIEMLVALVGILKAGGVYVPLDPTYPGERLDWMLMDTQAPLILTQQHLVPHLPPHQATVICLQSGWGQDLAEQAPVSVEQDGEAIAYINYTSGSTGKPKGVAVSHRAVLRLVFGNDYAQFGSDKIWLQLAPISFDAATLEIWGALLHGGRCVLFPHNGLPDLNDLQSVIAETQVTSLWLTASLFNMVVTECPQALQGVEEVLTGGEALSVPHIRSAQHRLPQTQFINGYGPTENTTFTCCYRIPKALPDTLGSIPIGRPIGNTQVYILDAALRLVPFGLPGELYVGGDGLATGYINRPDLTEERFIPNPFSEDPTSRLYKTGDQVRYLADGNIEFIGRVDHQVKIRGYRIELGEIESALRQQDGIQDAIAIVEEDPPTHKQLVGYVTAARGMTLDLDTIKQDLKQRLPEYMVPAMLIGLDAIPLTPNGKVDKRNLPKSRTTVPKTVTPRTTLEQHLSDLWCEVLGLQQVGTNDNFFDVGGTSILSLQIAARLSTELGQPLRAVKLYEYPTIRGLAQYLTQSYPPQAIPYPSTADQPSQSEAGIAIVGMVGRFPGAQDIDAFWSNLCNGKESITFFDLDQIDPSVDADLRTDPNYVRAKGVVDGAEEFDAAFFGISPRQAEIMDPQARLFLELAQAALENAGYVPNQYTGKIGLYAGSGQNTYFERHLCGRPEIVNRLGAFQTMLANEKDFVPTRASYKLNLTGPSVSVSTACSTSLVATIQAYQGLLKGDCDVALAGGISISTPQNIGYLYQEEGILSPDGHCRPFDAEAKGTTFNSGAGIVVLKRLTDALKEGDRIYAVLKGVGINNDGADKVSFTAPSVKGQAGAIRQAQTEAGFDPESIDYIEAHGTATPLGDPIEVEALTQAFQTSTSKRQFCAIGSVKGNIGHTVAAAGVAGLIKTALSLYHKTLPPSLGYTTPNPQIDFENSPFFVNTQRVEWPLQETPRRAGVSSFGVGGTNAHVVLEEPPERHPSGPSRPYQLLLLSAKTAPALEQASIHLRQFLQTDTSENLADVAYTLQVGRTPFKHRRFVVCQGSADACQSLDALTPETTGTRETGHRDREVVFVFPGQGSQYVNMGLNFYQSEPLFQAIVDQCAELLHQDLNFDIRTLLYPEPGQEETAAAELKKTIHTQPALFVVEYALAQLWMSWGLQPVALMGHSIGEFVAACLAGVFSLEDGLKLIAARGKMMWELPAGSMLSVRSGVEQVRPYLTDQLAIAAINSPSLCVISGPTPAIEALETTLNTEEMACKRLHTSHAFHSSMMDDMVAPFKSLCADISLSPPQIPFVSTATADWITEHQATDPQYWADHLRATVRFAESVQTLWQQPERILLEVGPRTTTTTLARQQIKDKHTQVAIASLSKTAVDQQEWMALTKALGQLWLAGVTLDWQQLYRHEYRHRVPLPTYPFERQRYWIDPLPAQTNAMQVTTSPSPSAASVADPIQPPPKRTMSETRPQRLTPFIKEILETASGLDLADADTQATFLEMGLDSLSLTQIALSLKKKFKVKISFRNLLEDYCSIQAVANHLDQSLPPEAFPAPQPTPSMAPAAVTDNSHANGTSNGSYLKGVSAAASPVPGNTVEALMSQQLQILSQQLALIQQVQQGGATPALVNGAQSHSMGSATSESALSIEGDQGDSAQNGSPSQTLSTPPAKSHSPGAKIKKTQDTSLTTAQQSYLDDLIRCYTTQTQESKRQTEEHRPYLADPRTVSGFTPLLKEMVYPIVVERSSGAKLWDVDGNEYVDITNGFGLNFFGWNPDFVTQAVIAQMEKGFEIGPQTPLAGKVAKLIAEFTGMDRVAFCNTGSEAVMAALRLARTVTGRDIVVTFKGDYHGTFDEVLYRAGANQKTLPAAPGIMPSMFENLLVLEYGTSESLDIIRQRADEIAAVLVEPVRSRDPGLQPVEFLQELRSITSEAEAALIFDEVVTGFRVHPGGAQAYFGIQADLATYGKVVGGGLPIGIVAGKADYMDALDGGQWQFGDDSIPEVGVTFFAGTFVRHPMALAAAEAVLLKLKALGPTPQLELAQKVTQFTSHLQQFCTQVGAPVQVNSFSSFFYITYDDDVAHGGLLFYLLRSKGVHVWEYRPCFFTLAHTNADIEFVAQAFKDSVTELQIAALLPRNSQAEQTQNTINRFNASQPPQPGAKLGRDPDGNPAWYIPDLNRPGKYLQVGGKA